MSVPLLYYTVPYKEIRSYKPTIPVLISAASCVSARSSRVSLRAPRLPARITMRAADSGGFAAMMRWGGTYPYTVRQYIAWLMRWHPQWAAMMDVGCIDPKTKGQPDPCLVKARQKWTTEMAWHFWRLYRDVPWAWVPTLHGYTIDQYSEHARDLLPLIHEMFTFYSEAATWNEPGEERLANFRVGIGSLCRRSPKVVAAVSEVVSQILGKCIPLHGWGWKLKIVQTGQELSGVVSLDTAAWNRLFGYEHEKRRASGLSVSAYSWLVSQPLYAQKVALAQRFPQQLRLFGQSMPFDGSSHGRFLYRFDTDIPA
jgi:hypothetical protein